MKYRSEIDGLRAVAVIPVILFHAGFEFFSGGFIGVDVFFVISGYLITTIIHDEIKNSSFSIVSFYERRARRILPALFFVMMVCVPFAWLWLLPSQYKDFSRSIVAVNLFSSNILFWRESGYFAAAAELKPLLHTWSLAVEEQFYLVFPLFLLLFRKFRDKFLLILLMVIVLLSLVASEYAAKNDPAGNFYLLPTRAWELGVGAVLAIRAPFWSSGKKSIAQVLSFLGLGMIVYSVIGFDETVPMPSVFGLIPVIGSALIIAYSSHQNVVGRILGWKPVVGIGLISYSAYLWHQPLFAFARIRVFGELTPEIYLALSFFSLLLAYFTWRYIETPFRNKKKFNRFQIYSGVAVVSLLLISFGLVGYLKAGFPARFPNEVFSYADVSNDVPSRRDICLSSAKKYLKPPQEACVYSSQFDVKVAIWGDSHAESITDALAKNLSAEKTGLIQLTYLGCPPVVGYKRSDKNDKCNQFNRETLEYIINSRIQAVVLLARWTLYLEGERFNNGEGGVEPGGNVYGLPIAENNNYIYSEDRIPEVGKLYRSTIESLLNAGKTVVLVYPVPEVGWNVPQHMSHIARFDSVQKASSSTSLYIFRRRSKNAYEQLNMLNEHPKLLKIYPERIFCNTVISDRCIVQYDGKLLYSDDDHLNSIGSDMLSKVILRNMKINGWIR